MYRYEIVKFHTVGVVHQIHVQKHEVVSSQPPSLQPRGEGPPPPSIPLLALSCLVYSHAINLGL